MPFYSRDWRSPGELWIKTDDGWEKRKILEFDSTFSERFSSQSSVSRPYGLTSIERSQSSPCANSDPATAENLTESLNFYHQPDESTELHSASNSDARGCYFTPPPYCQITVKPSREVGGCTGFSEVFKRLDFKSALHDNRRFNYVSKLLELLITRSLLSLAGTAQRVVFSLLEELAMSVSNSKCNTRLLNQLVTNLRLIMAKKYCFGQLLGSSSLWKLNEQSLERVEHLDRQIRQCLSDEDSHEDSERPALLHLPAECIRHVLLCLADHRDLESAAGAARQLARLAGETAVWKQLCVYHFSREQIDRALEHVAGAGVSSIGSRGGVEADSNVVEKDGGETAEQIEEEDNIVQRLDWKKVYHRLRRDHGLREEYAECVMLCRVCRTLFWRPSGHPCTVNETAADEPQDSEEPALPRYIAVSPRTLLTFLSL